MIFQLAVISWQLAFLLQTAHFRLRSTSALGLVGSFELAVGFFAANCQLQTANYSFGPRIWMMRPFKKLRRIWSPQGLKLG